MSTYSQDQYILSNVLASLKRGEKAAACQLEKKLNCSPEQLCSVADKWNIRGCLSAHGEFQEAYCSHSRDMQVYHWSVLRQIHDYSKACQAVDIPVLAAKGPVMRSNVYQGKLVGWRAFSDIDLFVPEEKLLLALKVFSEFGFSPVSALTERQMQSHLWSGHAIECKNAQKHMTLDLHWRLAERHFWPSLCSHNIFQRKRIIEIEGLEIPVLSLEDEILLVVLEGVKELWANGQRLFDLELLLLQRGEDSGLLEVSLKQHGLFRGYEVGKILIEQFLQTKQHHPVQYTKKSVCIARQISTLLCSEVSPDNRQIFSLQIRLRSFLKQKFEYCFARICIPHGEDWTLWNIPDRFFFLFYILKPLKTLRYVFACRKGVLWCKEEKKEYFRR